MAREWFSTTRTKFVLRIPHGQRATHSLFLPNLFSFQSLFSFSRRRYSPSTSCILPPCPARPPRGLKCRSSFEYENGKTRCGSAAAPEANKGNNHRVLATGRYYITTTTRLPTRSHAYRRFSKRFPSFVKEEIRSSEEQTLCSSTR